MKQPIRLTNKTAIALRKSAQKMRTTHYVVATILSIAMAAAAVFEVLMLIPLGFSLKARLQEIQGGEEDEARNY